MNEELVLDTVVAYADVDRNEVMLLPGVFKLLQEAAIKHADQFDAGTRAMVRGESWVLNRMATEIRRYPRYEEPVRVVTWSSGVRSFKGYRDFRVYSGDELMASASSLWLYVDLKTKSLVRVPDEVARGFPSRPGEVYMADLEKLRLTPPHAGTLPTCRASLRYSDIDGNGHVNNTTYFDLLQTALAGGGYSPRPGRIQIQFLKEIPPGAGSVEVRVEARDDAIAFSLAGPDVLFAQGLAS